VNSAGTRAGWVPSLAVLVAAAVTVGCGVSAAAAVGAQRLAELLGAGGAAVPAGLGAGALCAAVAAVAAARRARRYAELLAAAADSTLLAARAGAGRAPAAGRLSDTRVPELRRLVSAAELLRVRARLADEVVAYHQSSAQAAGQGVTELLSALVRAEEAARGQLAAEMHDTVAQSLLAARRHLADLREVPDPGPALDAVGELVAEAEEQIRGLMARTRPPELTHSDLATAVALLRDDLAHRYGLEVELRWPAHPYPLPLVAALTVYRFVQESLLNVVKHADTDAAWVSLTVTDGALLAQVGDDGPGFDVAAVGSVPGRQVGLKLLRDRARLAGGDLTVASTVGEGTLLTLRLPLVPQQRGRSVGAVGSFGEVRTAG
jgi:signal transduction histidine kinase